MVEATLRFFPHDWIILASSAEFKQKLDTSLRTMIVKVVSVTHGGEQGFTQAIKESETARANFRFAQEEKLLAAYMFQIAQDTKYCFGITDTLTALEIGAVETLIVWKNLDIKEKSPLEWIIQNYKNFGAKLEVITNPAHTNSQFVRGGGVGGILRYAVDLVERN